MIFRRRREDPRQSRSYLRAKARIRETDAKRVPLPPHPKIVEGRERSARINRYNDLVKIIMTGNSVERRTARQTLKDELGSRAANRFVEDSYIAAGAKPKITDPRRWFG